ncbi:MAG TPA: gamma-glutamylcyclotransferase [Pseudoneobacillus sp.]|nr:gamma-glutamylcyclotransferase [Pseudoneobacillus sp.]
MDKNLVFVYGTLRKNEKNDFLLKDANLISEQSWTFGELFDTGRGYPMMKPTANKKVYGEVYEVSEKELASLDQLENYEVGSKNNLYERVVQTIYTDRGEVQAFLYVSDRACVKEITSGDWKIYQFLNKKSEKIYYYAYGSCMDVERFHKAGVGHFFEKVVGAGILYNYSMKYLYSTHDGGRADIVEQGGKTEGILYETPFEAVEYLFKREGYYIGMYRATFVDVTVNDKLYQDVLTFHVYDKKNEAAPPEHYATEILRGSRNRVSEDYYKNLVQQLKDLQVPFGLNNWE